MDEAQQQSECPAVVVPVVITTAAEILDLFEKTLLNFKNDSKWAAARFANIKVISNTLVGDVGQQFMENLCEQLGVAYSFPLRSDGTRDKRGSWDIAIKGKKYELKTATEDVGGNFQFNHIRYHRQYDGLICLGVSPDKIRFGIWSAADVKTGKAGKLVSMEKGANASYKLTKRATELQGIEHFYQVIDTFQC